MNERYCVLYNPKAGNNRGEEAAHKLDEVLKGDQLRYTDITSIKDFAGFFRSFLPEEHLLLTGGDGTINQFVNATYGLRGDIPIWYYPTGSGNDFWKDIGQKPDGKPVEISKYLSNLPTVTVNGLTKYFLNGIGYGIDGYCCEMGDKQRQRTKKPVNYTAIAIKGLLFHYRPTTAKVTVDGKTAAYQKVWLAPTMYGRYYGGGMMPAPAQDRSGKDRSVTCMVMHGSGRLKTLLIFPSLFKGEHIKHKETVSIYEGKEITVCFDRPAALQIDGETITDVKSYTVTV